MGAIFLRLIGYLDTNYPVSDAAGLKAPGIMIKGLDVANDDGDFGFGYRHDIYFLNLAYESLRLVQNPCI